MQQSQEVRWFVPESLPDEVKKWRDERPAPFKDEERTDTYLRQRREDQGIKLRAGERIEVKFRVAELGNLRFLGGFEGLAERWLKLSLVLDSGSADEEINDSRWWVDVSKRRRVWTYEVSGEGVHLAASDRTLPGGLLLEVTEANVRGRTWWSLGFETFGDVDEDGATLRELAQPILLEHPMPSPLRVGQSFSYPTLLTQA